MFSTLIPFLPMRFWLLDLLSHFQTYYFVIATVIFMILVFGLPFFKKGHTYWHMLFPTLFSLILSGLSLLPYLPTTAVTSTKSEKQLSVMQANVFKFNSDHNAFLTQVQQHNPDVIAVAEATPKWRDALKSLKKDWPHQVDKAKPGSHGMLIFSKRPLSQVDTQYLGNPDIPTIFFQLEWQDQQIQFISLHPLPPVCWVCFLSRDKNFLDIAEIVKKQSADTPTIVLGDMNTTMFSPSYKTFINRTDLLNARLGQGLYPTWPVTLPFFLRLPIDHILHSKNLDLLHFSALPTNNSDHLTTLAVFH